MTIGGVLSFSAFSEGVCVTSHPGAGLAALSSDPEDPITTTYDNVSRMSGNPAWASSGLKADNRVSPSQIFQVQRHR